MKKIFLLIYILIFSMGYSNTRVSMADKLKKIDIEINNKKQEIKKIDTKKKSLEEQIEDLRVDILKLNGEKNKLEEEIIATEKKIDYSNINFNYSQKELERKKAEFSAKIIAWSRRKNNNLSFEEEVMLRKQFGKILYEDVKKINHISKVKKDIALVSYDIEEEKKKLSGLKNSLNKKIRDIGSKEKEKNTLIAKLNSERNKHVSTLTSLEKEKERIQKEIEKILQAQVSTDKKVDYSIAIKGIGKGVNPLPGGKVIVKFKENKTKNIVSNGVEILDKLGSPVKATHGGKVIYTGKIQGLGKVIMINYGYNTIGVYGNLISTKVKLNETVKQGENIGVLGFAMDGKPVLYYEVRLNLKPINPINVL